MQFLGYVIISCFDIRRTAIAEDGFEFAFSAACIIIDEYLLLYRINKLILCDSLFYDSFSSSVHRWPWHIISGARDTSREQLLLYIRHWFIVYIVDGFHQFNYNNYELLLLFNCYVTSLLSVYTPSSVYADRDINTSAIIIYFEIFLIFLFA